MVSWPAGRGAPAGSIEAEAVVLSAPVPPSAALLAGHVSVPNSPTTPRSACSSRIGHSIPAPGGLQLADHATWSWIADDVAKGISRLPAVTLHTRPEVAAARCGQDVDSLTADLLSAARPWLQDAEVLDVVLHRWPCTTPNVAYPKRCWTVRGGRLVLAGDAFGGSRVEGTFLSGLAAASTLAGAEQ